MQQINLISDTVTKPTPKMLEAMWSAEVGDDVFRTDPTVNALEAKMAAMMGKEAALFCPSGVMANQIAIACHTKPLDEVIANEKSHIYQYEAGAWAMHSGVSMKLLPGEDGKIQQGQIEAAIQPTYDWLPTSSLVVLENTCNKGGGTVYTLSEMQALSETSRQHGLKIHLDGARLFNAIVSAGYTTQQVGNCFDTLSICLSKGLGAPVGSLLVGDNVTMTRARKLRKALGGGMRQVGYLAAAGIFALDHHIERLAEDHQKVAHLAKALEGASFCKAVRPFQTNILLFDVHDHLEVKDVLAQLVAKGIHGSAFGSKTIRFVTHLDVSHDLIDKAASIIGKM